MREHMSTDVLIVGAGPTGLTLAIDLGRRGVRCTIIEQKEAPAFLPKMERANARTMEIYRRMGLAERIRAAGLRADCPMDVYVILAMNQPPLLRLPYPSVAQAKRDIRATNDGTAPLEPYQLISQYTLEPLLKSVAESMPGVTVRFGCEFLSLQQDQGGVTATVKSRGGDDADPRRLSGRLRRRREPGAPCARHQAARGRQQPGAAPGAVSLRRVVRAPPCRQRSGPGPPLSCGRRQGHAVDHAGLDAGTGRCIRSWIRTRR